MEIIEYISHVRNRDYMSGIERDVTRIKLTAEVFTKTELVIEILDNIEKSRPDIFSNQDKTFLDNCCGDGQFLSEVVIRKMERSGCSLEQALKTIYGVELMEDNVNECRKRLMGPNPTVEIIKVVNKNIVCADSLKYDYNFE